MCVNLSYSVEFFKCSSLIGCSGTVSWNIGDTNEMVVIMYSIPFDQNLYSNWLGVGIFNQKSTKGFFKDMYESELSQQVKNDFSKDGAALVYPDHFGIMATMSKDHQCDIEVWIYNSHNKFGLKATNHKK